MEVRKYLKTAEDVLALKDTDAKIYEKGYEGGYFKFVKGTLCRFNAYNGIVYFNPSIDMEEEIYTVEEEPIQKATAEDIGKLCWFWHNNCVYGEKEAGILGCIEGKDYRTITGFIYSNCKRMTPSEVAEVTGYEVKEKKK